MFDTDGDSFSLSWSMLIWRPFHPTRDRGESWNKPLTIKGSKAMMLVT